MKNLETISNYERTFGVTMQQHIHKLVVKFYYSAYNRGAKNHKQRVVMNVLAQLRRVRKEDISLSAIWSSVNACFEAKVIEAEIRADRAAKEKAEKLPMFSVTNEYASARPVTYFGD